MLFYSDRTRTFLTAMVMLTAYNALHMYGIHEKFLSVAFTVHKTIREESAAGLN